MKAQTSLVMRIVASFLHLRKHRLRILEVCFLEEEVCVVLTEHSHEGSIRTIRYRRDIVSLELQYQLFLGCKLRPYRLDV